MEKITLRAQDIFVCEDQDGDAVVIFKFEDLFLMCQQAPFVSCGSAQDKPQRLGWHITEISQEIYESSRDEMKDHLLCAFDNAYVRGFVVDYVGGVKWLSVTEKVHYRIFNETESNKDKNLEDIFVSGADVYFVAIAKEAPIRPKPQLPQVTNKEKSHLDLSCSGLGYNRCTDGMSFGDGMTLYDGISRYSGGVGRRRRR